MTLALSQYVTKHSNSVLTEYVKGQAIFVKSRGSSLTWGVGGLGEEGGEDRGGRVCETRYLSLCSILYIVLLLSCYRAAVSEKENSSILAGDIFGLGLPQLPGIQTHVVSLMPEREPATFA